MHWALSWRADPRANAIAKRHYTVQSPDSAQFVPPGRCLVLLADSALWVTSWPFPAWVKHDWAGAWSRSLFRNEGTELSSDLIREAVAATRWRWPEVPALGMVTFVDASKIRSVNPGYCYLRAGFRRAGFTKGGLVVLQLLPSEMPAPAMPLGATLPMEVGV